MKCRQCDKLTFARSVPSLMQRMKFNLKLYCSLNCAIQHKKATRASAPDNLAALKAKLGEEAFNARYVSVPVPYPKGKPSDYDYIANREAGEVDFYDAGGYNEDGE